MIIYLSTERFSSTIRHFLRFYRERMGGVLRSLTYEELFLERRAPIAHYIFTDFDRLSRFELECAAAFAGALEDKVPTARILNHPLRALERYPLLVALHRAGINDFTATRLEAGDRPSKYPVFIRAEDGFGGPETDLIHDDEQFDAALADLRMRRLPLRGRIAIGFANEPSADGFFRKYGAFHIDGRIVPHDLMNGRSWVVKIRFSETAWATSRDYEQGNSAEAVERELDFIRNNPHQEGLKKAFQVGGIDFGRADYSVVGGRVQIFEINTNPHLPWRTVNTKRVERRQIMERGLLEGFESINRPLPRSGYVSFAIPRPHAHNLHWPRMRLLPSLARKATNLLRRFPP